MAIDLHPEGFRLPLECIGGGLAVVVGDDDAAHRDPPVCEGVHEAQDLLVVADPDILADLVADDILSVDHDDGLGPVAELLQHADLAVRHESRKDPGSMVVVE